MDADELAGSDIETNPPQTNSDVQMSGRVFTKQVDQMPPPDVLAELDARVDPARMEEALMREGVRQYADPHKGLLRLIGAKRAARKG